ncbi:MAG: MltA domain-containing protein [Alphaproteobacteria bacterium]|nr:MltA domain-containing protein [Alphaproteobacteria bacterium]
MPNLNKRYLLFVLCSLLFVAGCRDLTTTEPTLTSDNAVRPKHMKKVPYSELPGWKNDDVRYALKAFRNTCDARLQYTGRVVPDRYLLEEKCQLLPKESADNATVRAWFESHFQPYKAMDESGKSTGVFTGYYAPIIPGCRVKTAQCNEPLMGPPTDGRNFKGVPRTTIVSQQIGKPLFWANIVDVQNIQIQGSGMLKLEDGTMIKLAFAGVNDMPFKSIGGQLQERGIKPEGGYSSEGVWQHLKKNPALAREVINNNPRYVFFKQMEKFDVVGAIGTPLSKIRSIAIDNEIYTLGLPVYVDTRLSDSRKFQRLMIAQDTGGAIKGWVRTDIYFGTGDEAYQYAQGQYAQGEKYILMPKQYEYVKPTW